MSLNPYLHFSDNCREAFEHYRSAFGGDFQVLQTFADGPEGMPVAEGDKDKVMHVSLPIGESVLMGSDTPSSDEAPTLLAGNNVHVAYSPASSEQADAQFARLAEGGDVTMPLEDQFWGSYFGSCTDKFGVHWMFDFDAS